jgi:hypothetical protein
MAAAAASARGWGRVTSASSQTSQVAARLAARNRRLGISASKLCASASTTSALPRGAPRASSTSTVACRLPSETVAPTASTIESAVPESFASIDWPPSASRASVETSSIEPASGRPASSENVASRPIAAFRSPASVPSEPPARSAAMSVPAPTNRNPASFQPPPDSAATEPLSAIGPSTVARDPWN